MNEKGYEKYKQRRQERLNKRKNGEHHFLTAFKVLLFLIVLGVVGIGGYKTCDYFLNKSSEASTNSTVAAPAPVTAVAQTQPVAQPTPVQTQPVVGSEVKVTNGPHDYSILIKKGEFKLYLLDHGQPVAAWGVALGKNPGQKKVSGDMKTPDGTFTIDEIDDASSWTHNFGDGKGEIKNAYGPWFLSLNTDNLSGGKWGGIGIHGTHDPNSIGTRASEGCIRLQNENLRKLKQYAKVGMKVKIEE